MTKVGDSIAADNANWSFSGDVSETFDSHVSKSVPLYAEGHDLANKISDFFLSDASTCYDLGCSTGTMLKELAEHNKSKSVNFIGIDSVPEMAKKAREKCKLFRNITILEDDITDIEFETSDLFIAYYTVQFVKPKVRQLLFDRIYEALNWGGALLLFEKVRAPDARFQDMMSGIYIDYKIDQGYKPDEIVAKSRSLKGVLEPFSTQGNVDLMKRAGFVDIMTVMKYVCFEGFLAIK